MASLANRRAQAQSASPLSLDNLMAAMTGEAAPSSGLVVADDGSIQMGSFTLTPRGLLVDEGAASRDEWEMVGRVLRKLQGSLQWLIGDWCAYGGTTWGETVEQIAAAFSYKEKSVHTFTYVCRHVHFSIRMENQLDFGHHALVAAMEPDLQRQWLEYAAAQTPRLSVDKMRKLINGGEGDATPGLLDAAGVKAIKKALRLQNAAIDTPRQRQRVLAEIVAARKALDEIERKVMNNTWQ